MASWFYTAVVSCCMVR